MEVKVLRGKILIHETNYSLCDNKPKSESVRARNAFLAIPEFCPIKESFRYCYNGTNVFKLSMIGQRALSLLSNQTFLLQMSIKHDTGISCFEASVKVERQSRLIMGQLN